MQFSFSLPALKYSADALSPIISRETIDLHYGRHLQTYLDNLNRLVEGSGYEQSTLYDIVAAANGALYNNGAQVWNHLFYFDTFSPSPRPAPVGSLLSALEYYYGSFNAFKEEFERQGATLFGSGWVWLAKTANDELKIIQASNADNPIRDGLTPLLTFDVWEHAYYVDYENRRAEHLSKLWDLVDWQLVESRYVHIL